VRRPPEQLRILFWEADFSRIDVDAHADSIMARVLEFGRLRDVKWLVATYGLPRIHRFFREVGHPELTERTLLFWRAFFKAFDEQWASPPAWRKRSGALWID